MRMNRLLTLGFTLAALGLVLTLPAVAQRTGQQPQSAPPQALPTGPLPGAQPGVAGVPQGPIPEESFTQRLARKSRLKEEDVNRFLTVFGPELQAELAKGKSVQFPGVGTFRIVQVPEHRDLGKDGRPVTVPAANSVEFLPDEKLAGSVPPAGGPAAVQPAATVPNPTFQQFPNQTRDPGQKVPSGRQPNVRTKG